MLGVTDFDANTIIKIRECGSLAGHDNEQRGFGLRTAPSVPCVTCAGVHYLWIAKDPVDANVIAKARAKYEGLREPSGAQSAQPVWRHASGNRW